MINAQYSLIPSEESRERKIDKETTDPPVYEEPLFAPGMWNRFFWLVIMPIAIVGVLDIALLWGGGTEIHREVWMQISEYSVLFRSQMYQGGIEVIRHVLMPLAITAFAFYLLLMALPYNPRVKLRDTLVYKLWKALREKKCRTKNEEKVNDSSDKVIR